MSSLSPAPLLGNLFHWHLAFTLSQLFITDGYRPPDFHDSSWTASDKGLYPLCVSHFILHVCSIKNDSIYVRIEKNHHLDFHREDLGFTNVLRMKKATLALPILAFTSDSVPLCVPTTFPKYMQCSTSSITSSPSMTGLN